MKSARQLTEKLQELRPNEEIEWLVLNKYGQIVTMNLTGDALKMRDLTTLLSELKRGVNPTPEATE